MMLIPISYFFQRNRRWYFLLFVFGRIFLSIITWCIWLSNFGKYMEMNLMEKIENCFHIYGGKCVYQVAGWNHLHKIFMCWFGYFIFARHVWYNIIYWRLPYINHIHHNLLYLDYHHFLFFLKDPFWLHRICNRLKCYHIPEHDIYHHYFLDFLYYNFLCGSFSPPSYLL